MTFVQFASDEWDYGMGLKWEWTSLLWFAA